jgi:flagellar motor switch protein FliN/FliY
MDGMLSQDEINALLNDTDASGDLDASSEKMTLSDVERDAIGEIANISMGTAATTLFSLVNRKVDISTPVVTIAKWEDIVQNYERPCVFIRISYTVGLDGSNILVLKENDVKIITDLMMGGEGVISEGSLTELHLSAISEAMNQMMGSSATSLSSMLNKTIDISPPDSELIDMTQTVDGATVAEFLSEDFVRITFRMEIGDLIDSEIMQLYPISFAKDMYECFRKNMQMSAEEEEAEQETAAPPPQQQQQQQAGMPQMEQPMMNQQMYQQPMMNQQMYQQPMMNPQMYQQPMYNAQPVAFQEFSGAVNPALQKENIDLIMDVPLDVTVELGRTSKTIQEILDFNPGTIIELNKITGEPIDVVVNGKYVAKGEVVVIEESFGVRITEIIKD